MWWGWGGERVHLEGADRNFEGAIYWGVKINNPLSRGTYIFEALSAAKQLWLQTLKVHGCTCITF